MSVFDEITDIDLGEVGGGTTLMADVPWAKQLLPLQLLSGGTARTAAFLLAMTHRENGLVMVDEIDNGIFHSRQKNLARAIIELSRAYKCQLVSTTHSEEWIENFFEAAGDKTDDIAFWRMERSPDRITTVRRFSLPEFRSGMAAGEMR